MHADSRKPEVSEAKAALAAIADALVEQRIQEDALERIEDREELRIGEKAMSQVAYKAGLQKNEFGIFKNAGFRGMYNMSLKELIRRKGVSLPPKTSLYELMGKTELAANRFRVTQTAERIRTIGATGLPQLKDTAHQVGSEVRKVMLRSSGVAPEDLPLEEHISKVKGRIKSAANEMKRLDSSPKPKRKRQGKVENQCSVKRIYPRSFMLPYEIAELPETTQVALGPLSTNLLAVANDEGMVLIEESVVGGQDLLDPGTQGFVGKVGIEYLQPGKYPARIGVDDEDRSPEGIKENIVGGLRADTMHGEQGSA
uniref:Uncharacterized protein n=1 Tax=Candidatus Kentrum sp. LFY TaxID=2126342 RepID=A0A450UTB5_9GAMM|nr:MAG: hypothetical protein BECKLFY1418A_GA0070994_10534 [Candidatus Kentron sp. LFY]